MHKLSAPRHAVAPMVASLSAAALLTFATAGVLHVGPPRAAAATTSPTFTAAGAATSPSDATLAAFPSLAHPDPAAARAIAKPNSVSFYEAHEPGLSIDGAVVLANTAALSLVLLPKAGQQICLMRVPASGASTDNCVDEDVANRSGVVNGSPGHVFGVLPNGVDSVRFVLSDGSVDRVIPTAFGYFEAPAEAVGGTFVANGVTQSLGDLIPASRTPSGMIVSR